VSPSQGALGEVEPPLAADPEALEEAVELGHQLERADGLERLAKHRERQVGVHRELEDVVQHRFPARGHHGAHGGEQELPDDVLVVGGLRARRHRREERQDPAHEEERVVGRRGVVVVRRLHGVEEPELPEAIAPGGGPCERARQRRIVLCRAEEDAPAPVEHPSARARERCFELLTSERRPLLDMDHLTGSGCLLDRHDHLEGVQSLPAFISGSSCPRMTRQKWRICRTSGSLAATGTRSRCIGSHQLRVS
jgi:hypothetical protein